MRLRHIKGCEDFVAASSSVAHSPEQYRGKWKEFFGNDHPLELEIGMGKGQFIRKLSRMHPEVNYIGLERYETVLMKAIQRKERGEISKIYLNFSDPWPKSGHAHRRLTSPVFLKLYDQVLQPEGCVEFKTDNQDLFEWSVETIPEAGWKIVRLTRDLHAEPEAAENVMTEYEEKFSSRGQKINKLVAVR